MTSPVSLSLWVDNCFRFLQKFAESKNWRIKLIAILAISSFFLATPHAVNFQSPQWESFEQKRDHPLSVLNKYYVGSNMEKKNYRFTVPLIARVFHLNDMMVYALQFVASILLLFISLLLAERITGDKVSGILAAAGMAFIYTGDAGFVDLYAWFDEFAFLFVILAMFSRKPYMVFGWVQLACWVDERAIIASIAVFIWWKLQELTLNDFSFKSFFRMGANSSFTALSIIIYFVIRLSIKLIIHLPSPHTNVGYFTILNNNDYIGIGLWEALEGFWIMAFLSVILLLKDWRLWLLFLISSFMFMIMTTAFSVYDITRSAAYMFPVIFIFLYIIKERFSLQDVQRILIVSSIICLIFPCYAVISPKVYWDKPLLIRLFFLIKNGAYY